MSEDQNKEMNHCEIIQLLFPYNLFNSEENSHKNSHRSNGSNKKTVKSDC